MLVLSRKKNESIVINGDIRIEVLQIKGKQIRLGITAPASMKVLRGELPPRPTDSGVSGIKSRFDVDSATTIGSHSKHSGQKSETQTETTVVECDLHTLVSTAMASV